MKITHAQIIQHFKNQKNLNSDKKRQSTNINAEMKKMLELPDKNFKEATIKSSNEQGCIPVKQIENKREKTSIELQEPVR